MSSKANLLIVLFPFQKAQRIEVNVEKLPELWNEPEGRRLAAKMLANDDARQMPGALGAKKIGALICRTCRNLHA
jgi:hypothetical protein